MEIWLIFLTLIIVFLLLLLLSVSQSAEFYRGETRHGLSTYFRASSHRQSRRNSLIWGIATIVSLGVFLLAVLYSVYGETNTSNDTKSSTLSSSDTRSSTSSSSSSDIDLDVNDIQVPEEVTADQTGTVQISGTAPVEMVQLVVSNSKDNYVKRVMINDDGTFAFDYPIIFPTDSSEGVEVYLCPTPILNELEKEKQKRIKVLPYA